MSNTLVHNDLKNVVNNFTIVFTDAQSHNLSSAEITLLCALNLLCDNDQSACFASNETLAKMTNLSSSRISHLLQQLLTKKLIVMKHFKAGKDFCLQNKTYHIFRLIYLNLQSKSNETPQKNQQGVAKNDHTPLAKNDNTPLLKIATNTTKKNITKHNTTNLSYKKHVVSSHNKRQKNNPKPSKREILQMINNHQDIYNYALSKIANTDRIIFKDKYALRMLIEWLKKGLHTLAQVQAFETQKSTHQTTVYHEKMPDWWYQKDYHKETPRSQAELKKINRDIDVLMAKLIN